MRHEPDVPRVPDEPHWCARGESPSSVDAEIRARENEDRIHVPQHIERKIDARGDLERTEGVAGRCSRAPDEEEPSTDLEEKKRHNQWLDEFRTIDVPEHLHHCLVHPWAGGKHQV